MLSRASVLLLCLLLVASAVRGEEAVPAEMLFRNWSTREGHPQDHVRAIVRTRDGFLWMGTDAGLARFDGVNFKTFGLREGLGSVAVLALLEARDGTLWVATQGGYVSTLRGGRIERTYDRGDIQISGGSTGTARWQTGQWSRAEPGGPQKAVAFCEDGLGRLWIGDTNRKLWCREESGWHPSSCRLLPPAGSPRSLGRQMERSGRPFCDPASAV